MESGDPLRKIDRIVKAERNKRARKRFFFLLSLRGIGLVLILLLAVSFYGASWRMMQLYDALEPNVAADTVRANFGDPHHRVLIKEDGEIWYYTSSLFFRWAYMWFGKIIPNESTTTQVDTWEDAPYRYDNVTLYFDSEELLRAWAVAGKDHYVQSDLGDIPGDTLDAYFNLNSAVRAAFAAQGMDPIDFMDPMDLTRRVKHFFRPFRP